MSKTISEQWATTLSVAELASWFKATAKRRHMDTGRMTKLAARGKSLDFFDPRSGNNPFAEFEAKPAFSVGVTMPRGGGLYGGAEMVTLHMYVIELGDRRVVEFALPAAGLMDQFRAGMRRESLLGHSARGSRVFLEHFLEKLAESDPQAGRVD